MISKTAIDKRIGRKMDAHLVDTIFAAKRNDAWRRVAQAVSGSRRQYAAVNLDRLEREAENGDTFIVTGKVLGTGTLTKKLRICALYFSATALRKIKQAKGEAVRLIDEIAKNPKAEGVLILR